MPDDTHMDLRERVVALEQMFVERDEGLQRESATRFTHPPPRWGPRWGRALPCRLCTPIGETLH
jgi:hypothetical protein